MIADLRTSLSEEGSNVMKYMNEFLNLFLLISSLLILSKLLSSFLNS